jgi:hypothetical protein
MRKERHRSGLWSLPRGPLSPIGANGDTLDTLWMADLKYSSRASQSCLRPEAGGSFPAKVRRRAPWLTLNTRFRDLPVPPDGRILMNETWGPAQVGSRKCVGAFFIAPRDRRAAAALVGKP